MKSEDGSQKSGVTSCFGLPTSKTNSEIEQELIHNKSPI